MSETETRTLDLVERELAAAREAERRFAEEAAGFREKLRQAARASAVAWEEEAATGTAGKGRTELSRFRERMGDLPGFLWAAQCRTLKLEAERRTFLLEDLDVERKEARGEEAEIREAMSGLQKRLELARSANAAARADQRGFQRERGEVERELAALEAAGPDFDLLKRDYRFGGKA